MISKPKFQVGTLLVPINRDMFPDDVIATTFLVVKIEPEKPDQGEKLFVYFLLEDDKVEIWADTMINRHFKELKEEDCE